MLKKIERATPGLGHVGTVAASETFAPYYNVLRRQFAVILFVVLLALGLGGVYVVSTPPSFTARASLLIDTRKVQLFQQSVMGEITIDTATVESQVQITKSETIALAVIKELRLTDDREFTGPGGGLIGIVVGLIREWIDPSHASLEGEVLRRVADAFASRLNVRRVGLTYIIEISFRSLDPGRAAQIANVVADAYVVDQLEAKYNATRRASVWLQDRIRELRGQASIAERAVLEFKAKHNIVDTGGRLISEQQVAELSSQLVLARAQTSEARARLNRIEEIMRADVSDATVTDTLRNEVVSKLRTQFLDLKTRETDWSARYGRDHQATVHLRNQMQSIRRSILDELARLAETYKSDFEIATKREESIQKGLEEVVAQSQTTNQAQVALRELESTAQTYRALYDNFLQRYMESVQQQSFPITEARVITPATPPIRKSHPQTLLILAAMGAGGLLFGMAIAWLRELSDRVFRTSMQVEELLQTDCIALVPKITDRQARQSPLGKAVVATSQPRTIVRSKATNLLWHVVNSPFSRFTEAIRCIKVAVDLKGTGKTKIIGITSTAPDEGKSTVAALLAQLMSNVGARTILVDCDLRNPRLTRSLVRGSSAGLVEVIDGKAVLDDVIWTDPSTNLAFLPATNVRVPHSSEVLASKAAKTVFDTLRERYDFVVVDLSPLAPVVDVRTTAHFLDAFILVIEWGRTNCDAVAHALDSARGVHENLLGVVLNKTDVAALARYDGSGYHDKRYDRRYGYAD